MKPVSAAALSALVLCLATPLSHAQSYTVESVGVGPNLRQAYAWAINERGDVVGKSKVSGTRKLLPYVTYDGVSTKLSNTPGEATDINESGVATVTLEPRTGPTYRAYLHDHGTTTQLFFPGALWTSAEGLNDLGHVVGVYAAPGGYDGYVLRGGAYATLPRVAAPRVTSPFAINNAGQIAGNSSVNGAAWRPVLVEADGTTIRQLPPLPGSQFDVFAYGMNQQGHVVGASDMPAGGGGLINRPVLWKDGAVIDLGTRPDHSGSAHGINDAGVIVGLVGPSAGESFAFVRDPSDGVLRDLNTLIPPGSGWRLDQATAISNAGEIVGIGWYESNIRAFRLKPVP